MAKRTVLFQKHFIMSNLKIKPFISNLKMKANYFNIFCFLLSPLGNNCKIPENQTYITDSKLYSLHFEENNIIEKSRSVDTYKAHGHYKLCIRMFKVCDLTIGETLSTMFRCFITQSTFPGI